MDHAAIVDLQQRLAALGLYLGEMDGQWEPDTRAALRAFQASKGIEPSGQLNEPTRVALLRAKPPEPEPEPPKGSVVEAAPDLGVRRRFGRHR